MKDGFVNVAAATPHLKVADISYNCSEIMSLMDEASSKGAKVTVFPEMCITGYTCHDLFWQDALLAGALSALGEIADHSKELDGLFFVGLPLEYCGRTYNVAAAVSSGKVLGIVPKSFIPSYNEFYEGRHFSSGRDLCTVISPFGYDIPVSKDLIFSCRQMPLLKVSAEICEDLWVPAPPSISHCMAGATVIVNLSASDEIVGKKDYRRELVSSQSARLMCGYIYCSAGNDESTQDLVFSGHDILAENGSILAQSEIFSAGITYAQFDLRRLETDRRRMTSFEGAPDNVHRYIPFDVRSEHTVINRRIDPHPFVPSSAKDRSERCSDILSIQANGLRKRLEHIRCRNAVIGISGGLDSTLALLVTVQAFDLLGLDHSGIHAVTMPGFGTTDRTYDNAVALIRSTGASFREINISDAVMQHFKDIDHDPSLKDVTYENSQARERTQILMDIANQTGGIVIGTGDLSELALGWATYNGDHMSMYGVNASIPKTLVRHLVAYVADTCDDLLLQKTLRDVLDTPVSPELLPPEDGVISQKTEDLVGPYELHDFFLYHMLRCGSTPDKIHRLASIAFDGIYTGEEILKWEKIFYKRFFAQQFKRSCLPDGPKVGSVAISPRGDLRMPSDASVSAWMKILENL